MNVHPDVNFEELARSTDDFNGAQLKAVCVEAGMLALRRDATEVLFLYCNVLFFLSLLWWCLFLHIALKDFHFNAVLGIKTCFCSSLFVPSFT